MGVGYIAVFAPGGLGVREAALAFVFSNIASVELIAVYAAMNRIIWVIAEVLFGLFGMSQKKIMSSTSEEYISESNLELREKTAGTNPGESDVD